MTFIPTYLQNHIKQIENQDYLEVELVSEGEEATFDIFYYGELLKLDNQYVITDQAANPMKIVARNHATNEELVLFDVFYGYDNLFCNEYQPEAIEDRPLQPYSLSEPCKVRLIIGQGIDYESEKEDYDFNEDGDVILIDSRCISWEAVKCDGFDFMEIHVIDSNNQKMLIMSEELS